MKTLSKLLVSLFIVLCLVFPVFGGVKNDIHYYDNWTSEISPESVCLTLDSYELLNMGQFINQDNNRLVIVLLLQIAGTENEVLLIQYIDNQEVWLIGYKVNNKLYIYNKNTGYYNEFDQETNQFKEKGV